MRLVRNTKSPPQGGIEARRHEGILTAEPLLYRTLLFKRDFNSGGETPW
ncbi:MAG: hypothetical protein Kow0025_11510 [Thermodesulfovibrionales bacterium]